MSLRNITDPQIPQAAAFVHPVCSIMLSANSEHTKKPPVVPEDCRLYEMFYSLLSHMGNDVIGEFGAFS